ncbi:MAG: acetate--CoA ligase family protein [Xanthobacteraceae bacterium]
MTTALAQYLFSPHSVAIIGQSDDPGKAAGRPLKFLRQMGYAGRVYPINPRRETVLGERAWPRISALPEAPDHAYIVLPTDLAVEAVEECAEFGVKVATVLADGFAEAGPEGLAREARLRALCARTGIRVVGPSSLGVVDLRTKSMLTANAALDERDLPVGRTFVASHSGSMIGALLSRGNARGARFAALVSVGNEIDLSLGEICEATLGDADIDGYMLFLETLRHAHALRRFAVKAAQAGKPVIAYKLGRSAAARELAVSHTGALAGEDDIADVFLEACGIARVDTLEGLIEGALLLSRVPPAHARGSRANVGVVTTTAGGATMVVDPLARRGINIEAPSPTTLAKFAAAGIEVKPARIIDLTIAGARYESMKAALEILVAAPEFDLVLAAIGSSARHYPQATVRPLIECAGQGSPLAVFLVPEAPDALAALSRAGVPNFHTPEACADALAAALARRSPVPITINDRRGEARSSETTRVLDELASGALLDRLGIARAPAVALGADIREVPRLPFAYPVAVKVLSADIAHKTEVGGVALNVTDGAALFAAIEEMRANLGRCVPTLTLDRVLVQPMLSGVAEVLIGYRVDRDVGPLIMVAAGGVLAEIERDRSLRLAPIDMAAAQEMVADLRSLPLLCGYRGRPKGDLGALARALAALSQLAHDDSIAEAEINPLLVLPEGKGVVALDALVRLK